VDNWDMGISGKVEGRARVEGREGEGGGGEGEGRETRRGGKRESAPKGRAV